MLKGARKHKKSSSKMRTMKTKTKGMVKHSRKQSSHKPADPKHGKSSADKSHSKYA